MATFPQTLQRLVYKQPQIADVPNGVHKQPAASPAAAAMPRRWDPQSSGLLLFHLSEDIM